MTTHSTDTSEQTYEGTALAVKGDLEPLARPPSIGESKPLKYSLPELREVGQIMFASGMFKDLKSVQQAMVKLLAGAEMGYGPFQSLNAFHVIEGKPTETAAEISARIKRSDKYDYRKYFIKQDRTYHDPVKDSTADVFGCVIVIKERGEDLEPVVFTLEDAAAAGLAGRDNWRKYKRDMLFARAITAAGRQHCADLFGGPVYTPEELGFDEASSGEVVSQALEAAPPQVVEQRVERKEQAADASLAKKVDEEEGKRDRVRAAIMASCKDHGITDDLRHHLSEELLGWPSMTRLTLPKLRQLKGYLKAFVEAKVNVDDPDEIESWLTWQKDLAEEVAL